MAVLKLNITDFRNLTAITIEPLYNGFNFIYGHNGSGKTSLLEAIYYLSLGRSFRSSVTDRIVNHQAEKLAIFANITLLDKRLTPVGLERHGDGKLAIRIDGENVASVAALADLTPVQLMDSSCHQMIDSGPIFRRKYLDWGVFYCHPHFLRTWKRFERALKQRNAALRHHMAPRDIAIWTHELVDSAYCLDQLRRDYVNQLIPELEKTLSSLITLPGLKITYQSGWNKDEAYEDVLAHTFSKDMQLGYTQSGPHKADLKITINNVPAKDILSRGQQKLFVCAMILGRGAVLKSYTNKRPIYLVDDLPSELDSTSRSNLIVLLSKQDAQIFITAVEREEWGHELAGSPIKMFHVEHGKVTEVS
jgi:DNA replication and repair protein RecF